MTDGASPSDALDAGRPAVFVSRLTRCFGPRTVLHELGLASYADGRCTVIAGERVELERSATYGACQKLLDGARRYLATAAEPLPAAA